VPKPSPKDVELFKEGTTLMGWTYVDCCPWVADAVVKHSMTVVDFHYMNEKGRFVFADNSFIAGQLGMMQALPYAQNRPSDLGNVAVIGKGHVGQGAMDTLDKYGVKYTIFDSRNVGEFFSTISKWDVVVACLKWEKMEYFMAATDIIEMKKGAYLVDISADGVEGSDTRSIYKPVFWDGHVLRYLNVHIPTLWAKYSSEKISEALAPHLNDLMEGKPSKTIADATVVLNGKATDGRMAQAIFEAEQRAKK
jgi:alanine dehydrogenase